MKTLYITDLDGTLMTPDARISPQAVEIINNLIARGMRFSFATARTPATALALTRELSLHVPVVLMNGVLIYDPDTGAYLKKQFVGSPAAAALWGVLRRHGLTAFAYTMEPDGMNTWYENLDSPHRRAFHDQRVRLFQKRFTPIGRLEQLDSDRLIYLSLLESRGKLAEAYEEMKTIPGVKAEFYRDVYSDDLWYLEAFSASASKALALDFLREYGGFGRVVGFGDNYNDLPLFSACDQCCAVANARDEVKRAATDVIGPNSENGVALWLKANWKP